MVRESGGFEGKARVYQAGTENRVTGHIPGFASHAGHQVDGRPYVTDTAVTSTPSREGVYRAGETISVSLAFDRPVLVEGTPSIALEIGDLYEEATYRSGSGTNTVMFSYDVQEHDLDDNGFALPDQEPRGFGEASMKSAGGEIELDVAYSGFESQEGHLVAGRTYVTGISVASHPGDDNTYEVGDTIEILVRFDDEVGVTGTPWLSLDLNSAIAAADFQSVHGSSDEASDTTGEGLVFAYTVQEGDEDDNGISVVENSLDLRGGTILDTNGNGPNLHHDTATFAEHLVGAVPPVLQSARTSEDGAEVTITFSENVHVRPDLRTLGRFLEIDVSVFPRVLIDIFVDGHRGHTLGPTIAGADLIFKMDTPITPGQQVTVSHDDVFTRDLPGILVDDGGNALMHFNDQGVANPSTLSEDVPKLWPVLSDHSLNIAEGGTGSYTVALGSKPEDDVAVTLRILPPSHLTASVQELAFTPENWASPQTVTLTAGTDDDEINFWQEIVHSSTVDGFVVGHVKVLVKD